jgi:hypothetical protein
MSQAERHLKRCRILSTWEVLKAARGAFYCAMARAKEEEWHEFVQGLEQTSVYDVLDRIRLWPCSIFPALVNLVTGDVAVSHAARGRLLGRAWFGEAVDELEEEEPDTGTEKVAERKDREGLKRERGRGDPTEDIMDDNGRYKPTPSNRNKIKKQQYQ